MTPYEETLVLDARAGSRPAFEELVRRTSRLVFARVYLEAGDMGRAEDLVQETYLTAFRKLKSLEDAKGFRSWLLKIAQNAAIDGVRRDLRKKRAEPPRESVEVLNTIAGPDGEPSEQMARDEQRQQVLALLRSLPEEYRLPLTLRYIGGSDYESICRQLGLTNGSLRGLLQRGVKMLRTEMEREE